MNIFLGVMGLLMRDLGKFFKTIGQFILLFICLFLGMQILGVAIYAWWLNPETIPNRGSMWGINSPGSIFPSGQNVLNPEYMTLGALTFVVFLFAFVIVMSIWEGYKKVRDYIQDVKYEAKKKVENDLSRRREAVIVPLEKD